MDMLDGGGGTTLLVPDSGVPVLLGSGVGWLSYLARMASLFARRAASVVSMGGGVVEISSSISGSGSCCTRWVTAGDCIRDETSVELCRGEILCEEHIRMGYTRGDWPNFRYSLAFFLLRVGTGGFLRLMTSCVAIPARRAC